MHLYFNKEGKLTTAIPHGEIPRQGNYLNLYVLLDSDFFISKGENHLNWTVSLELSFPNGELTIPFLPSKEPEFKTFVKNSGSEVTYDLVDEETYLTYEFNFTPEQATMNPGKFEALVSITKTNADLNKQGVAEAIDVESISYFGKAEIYIEKTFGSNKVIDNEASSHYKNLINLLKNLDSRKINKEFFYEELKRLSVDEVEVMELIEQYSANTESLEIGDSEKYRFERDDQIPTSKAVADNFVRKAGDTINGVLYTDANTPYVIGRNNKVGIRAIDENSGINVGQFAISNTNEETYEGHWANIQALGNDGKYYSIRVSKKGPLYKAGSEEYKLVTDAELNKYVDLDSAQDVNGVKNFNNGFKIKNNRVYTDSSERTVLTYKDESKIKIGGYETLSANTLSPDRDNNFDLGRSGLKWKDLYLSGYIISGESIINASKIVDKDYVDSLFSTLSSIKFEIVDELPTKNISNTTIYLKKRENAEEYNVYEEYIYIKNKWEMIGTTALDLENLKQYIDERIENYHPTYEYELDVLKGSEWMRVAEVMDEAKNSSGLFTFDCYGLNGDGTYSLMTTSTFSCTCGLDGSGKMVADVLPISHSPELTSMNDASGGGSGDGSGDGSGESGTYGLVSVNFERYDNQLYLCALVNYPSTDKYNKLIVNLKLENNLNFKPLNELEVVDLTEVNSNELQVLEGMTLKAKAPYEWRLTYNLQKFIDGLKSEKEISNSIIYKFYDNTGGTVSTIVKYNPANLEICDTYMGNTLINYPYGLFDWSRVDNVPNTNDIENFKRDSFDFTDVLSELNNYYGSIGNNYFTSKIKKISGKITINVKNDLYHSMWITLNSNQVVPNIEYVGIYDYTFENLIVGKDRLWVAVDRDLIYDEMVEITFQLDTNNTEIEIDIPWENPQTKDIVVTSYEAENNDVYDSSIKIAELLTHETTKSYEMYSVYDKLETFEKGLNGKKLGFIINNKTEVFDGQPEKTALWGITNAILEMREQKKDMFEPFIFCTPANSSSYYVVFSGTYAATTPPGVIFSSTTIIQSLSNNYCSIRLNDCTIETPEDITKDIYESHQSLEAKVFDFGDICETYPVSFFIQNLIYSYTQTYFFYNNFYSNMSSPYQFDTILKATGWYENSYHENLYNCNVRIWGKSYDRHCQITLTDLINQSKTFTEFTAIPTSPDDIILETSKMLEADTINVNSLDFGDGATITKDSSNRVNINYSGNTKVKVGSAETLFTGRVTPDSGKQYDLGRSGLEWKNLYLSGVITDGTNEVTVAQLVGSSTGGSTGSSDNYVDLTSDQNIAGAKSFSRSITRGPKQDGQTGYVDIGAPGNSFDRGYITYLNAPISMVTFKPQNDNSLDLGGSNGRWRNLYLSGNITDGTNNVSVSQIQPKLTAGAGITIDENNVISISYENGDEGSY